MGRATQLCSVGLRDKRQERRLRPPQPARAGILSASRSPLEWRAFTQAAPPSIKFDHEGIRRHRHALPNVGARMILLGVLLLILGFVFGIGILWTIGIILIVVGVILWVLGGMDRAVLGRRHWY